MIVRQAFEEWAAIPGNTALATKNRMAVNALLLKRHGGDDVRFFTAFYTRKVLAEIPDSLKPDRVRIASILVHVLTYAASKGECLKPEFDHTIASGDDNVSTTVISENDPESPAKDENPVSQEGFSHTREAKASTQVLAGESPARKDRRPKSGAGAPSGTAKKKRKARSTNTGMAVVQVDPVTAEVVARFGSMSEAAKAVGSLTSNIHRSVQGGTRTKGYFWFLEDTPQERIAKLVADKKPRVPGREPAVAKLAQERAGSMLQAESAATATRPSLSDFADEDLRAELSRRGWRGELFKRMSLNDN